MNASFRPAVRGDIPACAALFIDTFRREPWKEEWNPILAVDRLLQIADTPGFTGAIAEAGGEMAGFALGFLEPWHDGPVCYLKEACVHGDLQRRGIGTGLMEYLMEILGNQGVSKIYLLTSRGDMSETFYQKLRFYTSPKMILMAKYL